MNYPEIKNNKVFISGEILTDAEFSHEVYGEGFYEINVLVKRLSGQGDVLPVTVSERLIADKNLYKGVTINAIGQFRSYNKLVNGSILNLTILTTRNCNFRCKYCYESFENRKMTKDVCDRLIKYVAK